jgi:PKD repeat protein
MGNLWVTRFANWASGSLEKISYVGQDTAPEILSAQASVSGGAAPLAVTFTHSVMDATDQMSTLSVEWNFGDGTRQQVMGVPAPSAYSRIS